jgi:hypothetical protein
VGVIRVGGTARRSGVQVPPEPIHGALAEAPDVGSPRPLGFVVRSVPDLARDLRLEAM